MKGVIVLAVSIGVLLAYGNLLAWAWDTSRWWVFVAGALVTVWLGMALSTSNEHARYAAGWRLLRYRPRQWFKDTINPLPLLVVGGMVVALLAALTLS